MRIRSIISIIIFALSTAWRRPQNDFPCVHVHALARTWDAVIPDVHCGVGKECFLASLHGESRYGFKDGESGSTHRGGDSVRRRSASSSPSVLSSTTINGSPAPLPLLRLEQNDCLLIARYYIIFCKNSIYILCESCASIFFAFVFFTI